MRCVRAAMFRHGPLPFRTTPPGVCLLAALAVVASMAEALHIVGIIYSPTLVDGGYMVCYCGWCAYALIQAHGA